MKWRKGAAALAVFAGLLFMVWSVQMGSENTAVSEPPPQEAAEQIQEPSSLKRTVRREETGDAAEKLSLPKAAADSLKSVRYDEY